MLVPPTKEPSSCSLLSSPCELLVHVREGVIIHYLFNYQLRLISGTKAGRWRTVDTSGPKTLHNGSMKLKLRIQKLLCDIMLAAVIFYIDASLASWQEGFGFKPKQRCHQHKIDAK